MPESKIEEEQSQAELKKAIDQLTEPHQLELFGKTLSSKQILCLLRLVSDKSILINGKLNSILAGLSHEVFFETLPKLSDLDLIFLQHESATIPIQHHLTVLSQEKVKMVQTIETLILSLEIIIEHLDIELLGLDDLADLIHKIEDLSRSTDNEIILLSRSLSLAWNSNRIDLIEHLSFLKETFQKYKAFSIDSQATGLPAKLHQRLNKVYEDKNSNHESLPAIESLAKLAVWHVQDYFEVGLLNEITSKDHLDLDENNYSEKERAQYRAKLIAMAKENLEKAGLFTLTDLKTAGIYSKKALKEYLTRNSSH